MALQQYDDDPLDPKKALMGKLQGPGAEAGGYTGGPALPEPSAPSPVGEPPAVPAAPDYKSLGKYASGGYTAANEKFNRPWEDRSERYKMMTVLSNFDPKQGITPEVLAALNGAGISGAKFSGSGDKLNIENLGGDPRLGTGGTADVIKGLKGQNADTAWAPWQVDEPGGGAATLPTAGMQTGPGGSALAGLPLDSLLTSGDPFSAIQNALGSMVGGERTNAQALLQKLMGQ